MTSCFHLKQDSAKEKNSSAGMTQLSVARDIMAKTGNDHDNYLKSLGSRILCELNDLKRTPETAAVELGYSLDAVTSILDGTSSEEESFGFINKMGQVSLKSQCSHY